MQLRFFLAAAVLGPLACVVYTPDLVDGSGNQGGGGTTATSVGTTTTSTASTSDATATTTSVGTATSTATTSTSTASGGPTCEDNMQGPAESDVDCGGSDCPPCVDGKKCLATTDCQSKVCKGTCQKPSCTDMVANGDESDVDCGGSCATKCADTKKCTVAGDCESKVCKNTSCQAPLCGDLVVNAKEACDDGNKEPFDACSCTCQLPAGHLLLTEFVVTQDLAEFVEIYNPTNKAIDLTNYWLADYATYYQTVSGTLPVTTDFAARFPSGKTIAAGGFATISLHAASDFKATYGNYPTYDFTNDAGAPTMIGNLGATAGLTNTGEMLMLFYWDGVSSAVRDVDYVVYGSTTEKVDKTGIGSYKADTAAAQQVATTSPGSGKSMNRCPTSEDGEKNASGNGITNHDETSESGLASWKLAVPTPGLAPPSGTCP